MYLAFAHRMQKCDELSQENDYSELRRPRSARSGLFTSEFLVDDLGITRERSALPRWRGWRFIAQENAKAEMESALASGARNAPPADHLPTQVVTGDKESLTIDGIQIELLHWAPAHTSGDSRLQWRKGLAETGC